MDNRLFLSLLDPGLYRYDPSGREEDAAGAREALFGHQIDAIRARAMVAAIFGARLVLPEGWAVCSMPALTVLAEAWRAREAVSAEIKVRDRRRAPLSPFTVGYFRAGGAGVSESGLNEEEPAESFLQMYHRRLAPDAAPLEGIEFLNDRDHPDGGDRRRRLREVVGNHLRLRSPVEPLRDIAFGGEEFHRAVEDILPDTDYADGILALSRISQEAAEERIYLKDARNEINQRLPPLLMQIAAEAAKGAFTVDCAEPIANLLKDLSEGGTNISNFARVRLYLERYDPLACEAMIGVARQLVNRTMAFQCRASLAEQTTAVGRSGADIILRAQEIISERARGVAAGGTGEAALKQVTATGEPDWFQVWKNVWRIAMHRSYSRRFDDLQAMVRRIGPFDAIRSDEWGSLLEAITTEVDIIRLEKGRPVLTVDIQRRLRRKERLVGSTLAVTGFAFGAIPSATGAEDAAGSMAVSIGVAALFTAVGFSQHDIASSLLRRDLRAEQRRRATAFSEAR